MTDILIDTNNTIKINLPGFNANQMFVIQKGIIGLLDTKFFNLENAKITFHIKNGLVERIGLYTEKKVKNT